MMCALGDPLEVFVERRASQHDVAIHVIHVLAVREEDAPVLREVLVEREIEQSDLSLKMHHGHTGQRLGHGSVGVHDAHLAFLLRYEHLAVRAGKERDTPRRHQFVGDRRYRVGLAARFIGGARLVFP